MPEHGVRQHELHSHLRLILLTPVDVGNHTFERRFGLDVRQSEPLSSVHLSGQEDQRAVSTDGASMSLLFKDSSAGLSGDPDRDGH